MKKLETLRRNLMILTTSLMKKKIKIYIYFGESNRSAYERGLEHVRDIASCKTSSHMLRNLIDVHE